MTNQLSILPKMGSSDFIKKMNELKTVSEGKEEEDREGKNKREILFQRRRTSFPHSRVYDLQPSYYGHPLLKILSSVDSLLEKALQLNIPDEHFKVHHRLLLSLQWIIAGISGCILCPLSIPSLSSYLLSFRNESSLWTYRSERFSFGHREEKTNTQNESKSQIGEYSSTKNIFSNRNGLNFSLSYQWLNSIMDNVHSLPIS